MLNKLKFVFCMSALVIAAPVMGLAQAIVISGVPPLSAGPAAWLPQHIRDGCVTPASADEAEFLRCRAREALNNNSLDAAVVRYQRVLKRVPGDEESHLGMAYAYYFRGDTKRSYEHADAVAQGGGGYVPVAIQLKMNLDINKARYENMNVSAHELLRWAKSANNRLVEIDANLLVARIAAQYLGQCDVARNHLAAARALVQPADRAVAHRVMDQERDFRRWSEGRF